MNILNAFVNVFLTIPSDALQAGAEGVVGMGDGGGLDGGGLFGGAAGEVSN